MNRVMAQYNPNVNNSFETDAAIAPDNLRQESLTSNFEQAEDITSGVNIHDPSNMNVNINSLNKSLSHSQPKTSVFLTENANTFHDKHYGLNNLSGKAGELPIGTSARIDVYGAAKCIQIGDRNIMTITSKPAGNFQINQKGPTQAREATQKVSKPKKQYHITNSKKMLDEKNMEMLSIQLGINWKTLARKLSFAEGEIDAIEYDNRAYGLKEIIRQFLRLWVDKKAQEATLCALADALIDMKKYDIATLLSDT